jgi:tripartite-type tricarboxylate transporter receptor subunit TctC
MTINSILLRWLSAALLAAAIVPSAFAIDSYPQKAVRIIVPYAAGGVADVLARAVGQGLSEKWKQPVIVENRPGAAGNIGLAAVAKSAPDGYTLGLAPAGNLTVNPILFPKLGFDVNRDLAPITLLSNSHNVLVAHPDLPVKNFRELIAYAKAHPELLNYASPGVGSGAHLAGELLNLSAGIQTVHVTFNGMAPALNAVLGGHVQLMYAAEANALAHIKAGKLVPLAVAGPARLAHLKEVPTIAESGYPGFDVTSWYGLVASGGTAQEVVQKIHADVVAVLATAEIRSKLENLGLEPVGNTPGAFAQTIKAETAKWQDVVRRAQIAPM